MFILQISLFGYCGHSVVTIHGTFEDNFGNMWLYPNAQLMTAKFSVANHGNTTAFIKICQGTNFLNFYYLAFCLTISMFSVNLLFY